MSAQRWRPCPLRPAEVVATAVVGPAEAEPGGAEGEEGGAHAATTADPDLSAGGAVRAASPTLGLNVRRTGVCLCLTASRLPWCARERNYRITRKTTRLLGRYMRRMILSITRRVRTLLIAERCVCGFSSTTHPVGLFSNITFSTTGR